MSAAIDRRRETPEMWGGGAHPVPRVMLADSVDDEELLEELRVSSPGSGSLTLARAGRRSERAATRLAWRAYIRGSAAAGHADEGEIAALLHDRDLDEDDGQEEADVAEPAVAIPVVPSPASPRPRSHLRLVPAPSADPNPRRTTCPTTSPSATETERSRAGTAAASEMATTRRTRSSTPTALVRRAAGLAKSHAPGATTTTAVLVEDSAPPTRRRRRRRTIVHRDLKPDNIPLEEGIAAAVTAGIFSALRSLSGDR